MPRHVILKKLRLMSRLGISTEGKHKNQSSLREAELSQCGYHLLQILVLNPLRETLYCRTVPLPDCTSFLRRVSSSSEIADVGPRNTAVSPELDSEIEA